MVADIFNIDPAVVWSGSEFDVAQRLAAANVLARLRRDAGG